ncbi:hypothetical protein [Candidatus Tisiphia endosymbiont of Oplodontha viridula]|uniref:hypothetical protein n=1 Tax=Candidatus Tisiphia endosymbiont of Oplodontha viridula TaxID=3077925 RepID=UPI0035C927A0
MDKLKNILSELGISLRSVAIFNAKGEVSILSEKKIILDYGDLHALAKILCQEGNTLLNRQLPNDTSKIINKISDTKKYFCIKEEHRDCYIVKVFGIFDTRKFSLEHYQTILAKISFHINEHLNNIKSFQISTYRLDSSYIIERQLSIDKDKLSRFLADIKITKYPIRKKGTGQIVLLSPQQSKVMLALSSGHSFIEIEKKYELKVKTVEYYLLLIKAKTGYRKRLELLYAFRETNPWLKEFKDDINSTK